MSDVASEKLELSSEQGVGTRHPVTVGVRVGLPAVADNIALRERLLNDFSFHVEQHWLAFDVQLTANCRFLARCLCWPVLVV